MHFEVEAIYEIEISQTYETLTLTYDLASLPFQTLNGLGTS